MVRFAQKEELERVNELRHQVSDLHAQGKGDMCRPDFNEDMKREVYKLWEGEDSDVIVAIRDGVICGFACVEYVDRPMSAYMLRRRYYHLREFGVDKAFRRQGVATELYQFMEQEKEKRGFDSMELDVFAFNEGAIKFYESVGFKPYRIYMENKN